MNINRFKPHRWIIITLILAILIMSTTPFTMADDSVPPKGTIRPSSGSPRLSTQPSIGFVDIEWLRQNWKPILDQQKTIDDMQKEINNLHRALQIAAQQKAQELQNMASPDLEKEAAARMELVKQQTEIQKKQQALDEFTEKAEQNAKQRITQKIEAIAQSKGLIAVFDKNDALWFNNTIDITPLIQKDN